MIKRQVSEEVRAAADKLITAACVFVGTEPATLESVVKEGQPYWIALATAVLRSDV